MYEQPGPPIPVHTAPAPTSVDRVDESKQEPPKQMTDTALYLLSAIEKLAYRADFMEKRLRKIEDAVHILVAGAEAKPGTHHNLSKNNVPKKLRLSIRFKI